MSYLVSFTKIFVVRRARYDSSVTKRGRESSGDCHWSSVDDFFELADFGTCFIVGAHSILTSQNTTIFFFSLRSFPLSPSLPHS